MKDPCHERPDPPRGVIGSGLNGRVPLSRALIPAAIAAACIVPAVATAAVTPVPTSGAAAGKPTSIVPGISYKVIKRSGPQVLHVVTFRANALTRLAPAQASGSLTRRATLSDGMASRLAQGATAGINADYFDLATGTPSGILSVGTRLLASPEPARSALTIGGGGVLSVGRLALAGRYQRLDETAATPFPIRTFRAVNRPLPSTSSTGVVVYTPERGAPTPTGSVYEVVIALDGGGGIAVNGRVSGTVIAQVPGGGATIADGQVVLSGKAGSGTSIQNELPNGARVEIEAAIPGIGADAWGAVGGGPMIVQGGVAVPDAGEGFTSTQLGGRTTRTAVGQTADGAVLMVVSEGPQQGVRGYTAAEQGQMMASLGAVEAIGFDSGGSSLMAVGANQLIPWSSERAIADMLVAYYMGAQLSIPADNRVTPNGDGIADSITLGAQSPVAGTTSVTIARRGGGYSSTIINRTGDPAYTPVTIDPKALGMKEGPYTVTANLTPADGSAPTSQKRILVVDGTLGSLRVSSTGAKKKRKVTASFTLSRGARVTARVTSSTGRVVATLANGKRMAKGRRTVTWNGMIGKKLAPAGRYTVTVLATGPYGQSGLRDAVRVR